MRMANSLKEMMESKGEKFVFPYIITVVERDNGDESLTVYGGIEISSKSLKYDRILSGEDNDSLVLNLPPGHEVPDNQVGRLNLAKDIMKNYIGRIGKELYHHISEEHPEERVHLRQVQEVSKPDFDLDNARFIDEEDVEILFEIGYYKMILSKTLKK
jgi:hypothetical protein